MLEPHVQTLEDLGWEYLEEKLTIDLTDDLRAAIDPAPFGRRALEEDRGCFTSRGYLFPTDDPWPVSYTHLDVYKRQAAPCLLWPMASSGVP